MKEGKLNRADTINLLRKITKDQSDNSDYVEDPIVSPFGMNKERWRYTVLENGDISVQRFRGETKDGQSEIVSLRQFIWNRLNLDHVCKTYLAYYEKWVCENFGIPYLQTLIVGDGNARTIEEFAYDFCTKKGHPGLRLVMGEYGMGKSSFCCWLRRWAIDKTELFCEGTMAFPFVFDLNDYRNLDFSDFVQNRLIEQYGLNISYNTFLFLCQKGFFYVVLDAWDQMHHNPIESITHSDIDQFSHLWEKAGKVLITCRRNFYQQQIHNKENELYHINSLKIYNLKGFNLSTIKEFFHTAVMNSTISLENCDKWLESCWDKNRRLFEKPLNCNLLAKYFPLITKAYRLDITTVDTYHLLDCILCKWKSGISKFDVDFILKLLVKHSLRSALNRSFSKEEYCRDLESKNLDSLNVLTSLKDLGLITVGLDSFPNMIEFRLPVYQEFLWARYAMIELDNPADLSRDTLLNLIKLNPDVRAWMVDRLTDENNNKSKQLLDRLYFSRYKYFDEVGYSASNVLMLLRELSNTKEYKEAITDALSNLRNLPLNEADLRGMDLSHANFENSILIDADLSYTTLNYTNFRFSNLTNARWKEHKRFRKCTFLPWCHDNIIASGTADGGILTFNIDTLDRETYDMYEDRICGITADSSGVYAAWSDGWVSFISNRGLMQESYYVSAGGLDSISSGGSKYRIIIGTNSEGLYYINWNSGIPSEIKYEDGGLIKLTSRFRNVCYSTIENEDYVAFVQDNNRLFFLILDKVSSTGTIIASCTLGQFEFGDICFAGYSIVFYVVGKGVYFRPVSRMIGDIEEIDLLNDSYLLHAYRNPVELTWAKESNKLFVVQKSPKSLKRMDCYTFDNLINFDVPNYSERGWVKKSIDLDYNDSNRNDIDSFLYPINASAIDGMSVSADGNYLAFAGENLVVFKKMEEDEDGIIYSPACEIIEAKIQCQGADFTGCEGLSRIQRDSIRRRGGKS